MTRRHTSTVLPRFAGVGAVVALAAAAATAGPLMAPVATAAPVPTAPTEATCGPLKIAYVVDMSLSYSEAEFDQQKQAISDSVTALSTGGTDVSPSVAIYGFGRESAVGDAHLIGKDGKQYETSADMLAADAQTRQVGDLTIAQGYSHDPVAANAALPLTDVSSQAGLNTVLSKLDGLQRDQRFGSGPTATAGWIDDTTQDFIPAYADSDGTNWDAALKAVQDSGEQYDAVIVVTDGLPNMVYGQDAFGHQGPLEDGEYIDGAFRTTQVATDAASARSTALTAQGTKVVPLYVKSTQGNVTQPQTPEEIEKFIAQLSAAPDAKAGRDYFTVDSTSTMTDGLLGAATATCDPVVKIDKKLADGTDAATLKPGDKVTFDVTALGAGNVTSHTVAVEDLGGDKFVPDSIEFSDMSKGEIAADGRWTIGDLGVGETATAKVTLTLSESFQPGDDIINDINITSQRYPDGPKDGKDNPDAPGDDDRFDREKFPTPPPPSQDTRVDKARVGEGNVKPGDEITYRLTVWNADQKLTAKNVTAKDAVGEGLAVQSISVDDGSRGTVDGTNIVIGDMAPNERLTYTVTAKIAADFDPSKPLVNDVYLSADGDPAPEKPGKDNPTVEDDDDNFDRTTVTVTPPEKPTPETTPPTPEQPAAPPTTTPPTPEQPAAPPTTPKAPKAPVKTVQGAQLGTGGEAASNDTAKIAGGGIAAVAASVLVALGIRRHRRNKVTPDA